MFKFIQTLFSKVVFTINHTCSYCRMCSQSSWYVHTMKFVHTEADGYIKAYVHTMASVHIEACVNVHSNLLCHEISLKRVHIIVLDHTLHFIVFIPPKKIWHKKSIITSFNNWKLKENCFDSFFFKIINALSHMLYNIVKLHIPSHYIQTNVDNFKVKQVLLHY